MTSFLCQAHVCILRSLLGMHRVHVADLDLVCYAWCADTMRLGSIAYHPTVDNDLVQNLSALYYPHYTVRQADTIQGVQHLPMCALSKENLGPCINKGSPRQCIVLAAAPGIPRRCKLLPYTCS